jgi:hypothetical protein
MRRFVIPALAGLAVAGIAACSPDSGDFKKDAEDFIDDDDGDVEQQIGTALSDATCEDPASSDKGTTFNCTAVGENGTTYAFFVEITGDNSYEVGGGTPTGGTTAGTAPAGTATTAPTATTGG